MRVHLEDRWQQDAVAVYVVDGRPIDRILRLGQPVAGGELVPRAKWDRLEPDAGTANIAPTLELPRRVWEAVIAAGAELAPADRTMDRAWSDAIATRDRLLALVERVVPGAG